MGLKELRWECHLLYVIVMSMFVSLACTKKKYIYIYIFGGPLAMPSRTTRGLRPTGWEQIIKHCFLLMASVSVYCVYVYALTQLSFLMMYSPQGTKYPDDVVALQSLS